MFNRPWRPRVDLPAIHDADLVTVLRAYGLFEDLAADRIKCCECQRILSLDNIGTLRRRSSGLELVCDRHGCLFEDLSEPGTTR